MANGWITEDKLAVRREQLRAAWRQRTVSFSVNERAEDLHLLEFLLNDYRGG